MAKYLVRFDVEDDEGGLKPSYFSNDDKGLGRGPAENLKMALTEKGYKNARLVSMKERKEWQV